MRLIGYRCIVKTPSREKIFSTLVKSNIVFSKARQESDGFSFSVGLKSKKKVLAWSTRVECPAEIELEGVFVPILSLKNRFGIIFALFLSLFLIILSTFFVWSVRIEGNETVPDEKIISLLKESGFYEGVRKGIVDTDSVENEVLNRCHEISFLSINVHGMVADVVVHERISSAKPESELRVFDLVADCDGVIVSSTVFGGQKLFSDGDTVVKGQLLVAGLTENSLGGILPIHSSGKIYARTSRTLTFKIPLKFTEHQTDFIEAYPGVRVLGHSFHHSLPDGGKYNITLFEEPIRIFGLETPFTKEVRTVEYYDEAVSYLTDAQAEALAFSEYERYISTEIDSASVVKEEFVTENDGECFVLTVEIDAIENIAKEKKIEITEKD